MDSILLAVTGVSLALAAVMGVLLARMLREERRRSDARVALLSELADQPAAATVPQAIEAPAPRPVRVREAQAAYRFEPPPRAVEPEPQPRVIEPEPLTRIKPSRLLVLDDEDLDLRPELNRHETAAHELFEDRHAPSAWPRRLAVLGSIAAAIALSIIGWSAFTQRSVVPASVPSQIAEPVVDAPLELLSLGHSLQDGMFTITGLVQNPQAGRDLSRVKATLFVFGPGGSFITSGRAPLDFTSLGPGEESPFVIRVPVTGEVARYRIGFRGEDDRVLAHVDRRQADAFAQK